MTSPSKTQRVRRRRQEIAQPSGSRGLFARIRAWLDARKLIDETTPAEKHLQAQLRLARLISATHSRQPERAAGALADLVILATAMADQLGCPLETCIDYRLKRIRYRDGEVVDGSWRAYRTTPEEKR